ncbi:hypothetical protein AKO1_002091 [Acrasis kona]|uniref:Uncharacterized protein n=1 Tax=Acrasis kona TaxID=1008807 RepID=A0AAW2YNX6_9EUKA
MGCNLLWFGAGGLLTYHYLNRDKYKGWHFSQKGNELEWRFGYKLNDEPSEQIRQIIAEQKKKLDYAKRMNQDGGYLRQAYMQLGGDEGIKNMLENNLSEDQVLNEIKKRADIISTQTKVQQVEHVNNFK